MNRLRNVLLGCLILGLAACAAGSTTDQSESLPSAAIAAATPAQEPQSEQAITTTPEALATSKAKPTASADRTLRDPNAFTLAAKLVPLAEWSGKDLDGNDVSTASLSGKKTVVNFWASWCGPCREEWPILQSASQKYTNVRFVGINIQDSLERARAWLAEHPTNYVHYFDDQAFIKASLTTVPNMGLPITVVLNAKGQIFAWYSGAIKEKSLEKVLS